MYKTKIIVGTVLVLAILVMFAVSTVPAVNAATAYFIPEDSSAETGDHAYVKLYVDLLDGETLGSQQTTILFNPTMVDITKITTNCDPIADDTCFLNVGKNLSYTDNGYAWSFTYNPLEWEDEEEEWVAPQGNYFTGPRTIKVCRFKVEAVGTPGVSPFDFGFEQWPCDCPICQYSALFGQGGVEHTNTIWHNGTFTHEGEIPVETFEKELVTGWNLVSLPLTALDMTVGSVFNSAGGSYSELYSYDAETNNFVALTGTDVLENGVGYYIRMNAADTWTYEGLNYTDMTVSLEQGLNMIGWLNCTKDIEDALSSIEGKYRYVARWDAQTQNYEVYVSNAPAFNDFDTMEPGVGYFISMKVDGETISEEC